jgi:hypothetical protein
MLGLLITFVNTFRFNLVVMFVYFENQSLVINFYYTFIFNNLILFTFSVLPSIGSYLIYAKHTVPVIPGACIIKHFTAVSVAIS